MTAKVHRGAKIPYCKVDNIKHCKDFVVSSHQELNTLFGSFPQRVHKNNPLLFSLADMVLMRLDHEDILKSDSIKFRDIKNFKVEIITKIARNLAEYILVPQRFNNDPSSVVASSLNLFTYRIGRFRSGHKLPMKTLHPLTKRQFGFLVKDILDNPFIWDYAYAWTERYKWRLEHGYTNPI